MGWQTVGCLGWDRRHSSPAPLPHELLVLKLKCPWHFWAFNALHCISLLCIPCVFILIYRDNLKIGTWHTFVSLSLMISGVVNHFHDIAMVH